MGFRTRTAIGFATALAGLTMIVAPAGSAAAYDFPSTNDANRELGRPHVNEVSKGPGTITLDFVNESVGLAYFEYRIDGAPVDFGPHPVLTGDIIYPGVCRQGGAVPPLPCVPDVMRQTFSANATVEVRLAIGGERDWDFDWTTFTVWPTTKDDCKNSGWQIYGFANQGQCIKFVNAGQPADDRGKRD